MPQISIVIPVYQVEEYIENCLISLSKQTYKDFEVILVNDGTSDRSIEVGEAILQVNEIRYRIIHQDNQGTSAARNSGIYHSVGEWIICIDPDDVISDRFLETLYHQGVSTGMPISICNYQIVKEDDLFKPPSLQCDPVVYNQKTILDLFLVRKINIVITAMLIKKDFLLHEKLWYEPSIRHGEDAHYIWRVLFSQERFVYNETPLYNYFLRSGSTTTSPSIDRMMTSYYGFQYLSEIISKEYDEKFAQFLMARYVLSLVHVSAKYMKYDEFLKLSELAHVNDYLNALVRFPDIRVKCLAILKVLNSRLFYFVCRR